MKAEKLKFKNNLII